MTNGAARVRFVVFACQVCGSPLGTTDGSTLHVGAATISKAVILRCLRCSADRTWRPVAATLTDIPVKVLPTATIGVIVSSETRQDDP